MGAREGRTPEQAMRDAHPIDRIIVMTSGQIKRYDLDSIDVGDIEVTDPDGTHTKIAGMKFNAKRDYGKLGQV